MLVKDGDVHSMGSNPLRKHPKKQIKASLWFQPILKNISQIEAFPQVEVSIQNI